MMRLPCPWCGECDEIEFVYGGPAAQARPALDCSDEVWGRYLYFRDNVKGASVERWRHSFGCGQWFNLLRDSVSHRVSAAVKFGEALPGAYPKVVDPRITAPTAGEAALEPGDALPNFSEVAR